MGQLNSYPNASTIDAVNDELVIWTNSLSAVQNINRNTLLNLSSQPVGLTDSQTLTNKTLTSPTVSSPTFSGTLAGTYTIGGTPTFPASVTQNTVSQTLTNKTLTSPTITSPTITNATISADTLTGYTVSNTGTIYGIPITTGVINTAGTINGASLVANSVTNASILTGNLYASKFYNPYKFSVWRSAAFTPGSSGVSVLVPFDTTLYDTGSNFTTGAAAKFTAPIAGFYHFDTQLSLNSNANTLVYISLYKNGVEYKRGTRITTRTADTDLTLSCDVQCSATDTIDIRIYMQTAGAFETIGAFENWFNGSLVSAT